MQPQCWPQGRQARLTISACGGAKCSSRRGGGRRNPEETRALRTGEGPACAWQRRTRPLFPCPLLVPEPGPPGGSEDASEAWPGEFFFFFFSFHASSCHMASDHDISIRCCQCLGLRGMSVRPGLSANKKWCPEPAGICSCPVSLPLSHDQQTRNSSLPQTLGSAEQAGGDGPGPGPQPCTCVSGRSSASALPGEGTVQNQRDLTHSMKLRD